MVRNYGLCRCRCCASSSTSITPACVAWQGSTGGQWPSRTRRTRAFVKCWAHRRCWRSSTAVVSGGPGTAPECLRSVCLCSCYPRRWSAGHEATAAPIALTSATVTVSGALCVDSVSHASCGGTPRRTLRAGARACVAVGVAMLEVKVTLQMETALMAAGRSAPISHATVDDRFGHCVVWPAATARTTLRG